MSMVQKSDKMDDKQKTKKITTADLFRWYFKLNGSPF